MTRSLRPTAFLLLIDDFEASPLRLLRWFWLRLHHIRDGRTLTWSRHASSRRRVRLAFAHELLSKTPPIERRAVRVDELGNDLHG